VKRARPKKAATVGKPLAAQISGFLSKYSPAIQTELSAARRHLRALFPRGFELVFDNYNALVFGFSATELACDSFLSVAGYPRWVTLFFLNGAALRDPRGLLEGSGKQVRSIRLKDAETINDRHVQRLIAQAIAPRATALSKAPALKTLIKTIVTKHRPRRPPSPSPLRQAGKKPPDQR
jgi:Domain of unknown function (DU1801)